MKTALVATSNLLFRSKLSLMLQELEIEIVNLRADGILSEELDKHKPVIVIFDLGHDSLDRLRRIRELRSADINYSGPILCFGPHIATDILKAAEDAGADLVVPNSVISARGAKVIDKLLRNA